jgi:CheY-like chemotaxis protein
MSGRQVNGTPLRVLIVDPHEVSRGAIRALLRTEGVAVVADVSTGGEALALAGDVSPDVVIADIGRGELSALDVTRLVGRFSPASLVVLASSSRVDGGLDDYPFLAKADICAQQLRLMIRAHNQSKESQMSLQAYLDNITARTGKTPEEFVALARTRGLLEPGVKPNQIVTRLKDEYGLGHGHAMAIVATIKKQAGPDASIDQKVARHFAGKKSRWRPVYDQLVNTVAGFGADTDVAPAASYLNLRKAGKKFAIVQVTADRLDLGLKLRGVAASKRLESAGSWNAMVTHRVRVHRPDEVDGELLGWLEQAYAQG